MAALLADALHERYERAHRLLQEKHYAEAYALYEQLAREGDPNCEVPLAWMDHRGLGTPKDDSRALERFSKAADAGSAEAAFYCGRLANTAGKCEEAVKWFYLSAEKEYGPGLLWLGLAHIRGLGVPVNQEKGVKYLEHSASTGNYYAQRTLALMMIRGKFGWRRIPEGFSYLARAVIALLSEYVKDKQSDKLRA